MQTIFDFPDYAITKEGKVWSYIYQKWLNSHSSLSGHLRVWLYKDGKKIAKSIHRLVLETFIENCPKGMECRHLNNNPKDNRLENLKWGTRSENQVDSVKHQTHARLKLTEPKVKMIIYMYKTKLFLQKEIAKIYGVTLQTISDIICKKTWRHIWTK